MEQESKKVLFQWNFIISGLIPEQVKLKRKIWLKKGVLLLDKKGDDLHAYSLGNEDRASCDEKKITPYLWISSLISNNATDLTNGGGCSISSEDKLGTQPMLSSTVRMHMPDEAVREIEKYAHKFLGYVGKLHDKYINVINENEFISIALDYFHDAQKKFVYNDEGFISAMISLESLFNENPSDIKYKLSHRAGFLLGLCGIDSVEAFEKLKTFYNHRSTLVHGGGFIPYDPDRYLITHYTRKAIIIFLILLSHKERQSIGIKKRKENLLKEIDYAMFDELRRKKLKLEINKGMKDFKLKIRRTFEVSGKDGDFRTTAW
jgi:Apea-like HEPN